MHRTSRWSSAVAALAVGLVGCQTDVTSPEPITPLLGVGNEAPTGTHFNLNIIGVANPKNNIDMGNGGGVIFVALGTKDGAAVTTKIMLQMSTEAGVFDVIDKNGTDGVARFSLPLPGTYTIWARPLGRPERFARITTCAEDVFGAPGVPGDICSTQNELFIRDKGKEVFKNVTTNLTTIFLNPVTDPGAVLACGGTTVSLFDDCLIGYFWKYDNNGLKILQLRFYLNPVA